MRRRRPGDDAAAIEHGSLQSLVLVTGLAGATFIICRDTEIAATHFRKPSSFARAVRSADTFSALPENRTLTRPAVSCRRYCACAARCRWPMKHSAKLGRSRRAGGTAVAQRPRIVELEHVQRARPAVARGARAAPRRCRRRPRPCGTRPRSCPRARAGRYACPGRWRCPPGRSGWRCWDECRRTGRRRSDRRNARTPGWPADDPARPTVSSSRNSGVTSSDVDVAGHDAQVARAGADRNHDIAGDLSSSSTSTSGFSARKVDSASARKELVAVVLASRRRRPFSPLA